jgi:uncharacterized protein YndB with AHSA1/START domain
MHVEGEILIDRPVEEVFDYVADERNEPLYNPQMTRADKVTPGAIGLGTRFQSVMTGTGREVEMTIEFTEFDRPRRITERTHMTGMDISGALFFDPVESGTKMRWVWDLQPRGFYRFLGPLVRRMGDRQERAVWTGLKRVLEQPAATVLPAGR